MPSELAALVTSQATMEVIDKILMKAIDFVESLQAEASQLITYFDKIGKVIKEVSERQENSFLKRLETKDKARLLGAPLAHWEAQSTFALLVLPRGLFAVIYQNAQFFGDVSTRYLLPSIREVCRLLISAPHDKQTKAKTTLAKNTRNYTDEIRKLGQTHLPESYHCYGQQHRSSSRWINKNDVGGGTTTIISDPPGITWAKPSTHVVRACYRKQLVRTAIVMLYIFHRLTGGTPK